MEQILAHIQMCHWRFAKLPEECICDNINCARGHQAHNFVEMMQELMAFLFGDHRIN